MTAMPPSAVNVSPVSFCVIDVGRAAFGYNTLTNAARQGARVAAVNQVDPVSAPWSCQANKPVDPVSVLPPP